MERKSFIPRKQRTGRVGWGGAPTFHWQPARSNNDPLRQNKNQERKTLEWPFPWPNLHKQWRNRENDDQIPLLLFRDYSPVKLVSDLQALERFWLGSCLEKSIVTSKKDRFVKSPTLKSLTLDTLYICSRFSDEMPASHGKCWLWSPNLLWGWRGHQNISRSLWKMNTIWLYNMYAMRL